MRARGPARPAAALAIVACAMPLLLGGCRAASAAAPTSVPGTSSAASAVPTSASPNRTGTAQLDEVDAAVDRIEQELDSDGGR